MTVHIYNSLTKKKEEFIPLEGKTVKIYTCGVTVYDHSHIGHARSLYIFDLIKRYLQYRGYDVHFVRNITDIDDKIINRAKELNKDCKELVQEYIIAYQQDLKDLGLNLADHEPRATENIDAIIGDVQRLMDQGYAYEIEGDVYYSVRKFKEYGKLSGQSIEKMLDAVRIKQDVKKKDPLDFALWKKSKDDEPGWDSPWGRGRPGWHIECSCMSLKTLQCETLDIHAGGRDLIFPHHENEIAQAEVITGKPFAKYWMHHGLLTINGQKMAKSLGNFITIREAIGRYPIDDLKMLFLASHYASSIDFSEDRIEDAHQAMQRFDILFWKAYEVLKDKKAKSSSAPFIESAKNNFIKAMDDDFNTPRALASLFDLVNETNKYIAQNKLTDHYYGVIHSAVETIEMFLKDIFGLLGNEKDLQLTQEQKDLIEQRAIAREKKEYQRSDELREQLKAHGIIVEDAQDGQTWRWT